MWQLIVLFLIAIVQFSDVIGFDENQLFTDDDQLPTIDLIENMVKWDDDVGRHGKHGRKWCPKWKPWENVTCWWPSESWSSLPSSCTHIPKIRKLPSVFQDLIRSKVEDKYDFLVAEYQKRGSPAKCGHCSRSFQCRVRSWNNSISDNDDDDDSNDDNNRRKWRPSSKHCPPKQVRPQWQKKGSSCQDNAPCVITPWMGRCTAPMFLGDGRASRMRWMAKKGHTKQLMTMLHRWHATNDEEDDDAMPNLPDSFDQTKVIIDMPWSSGHQSTDDDHVRNKRDIQQRYDSGYENDNSIDMRNDDDYQDDDDNSADMDFDGDNGMTGMDAPDKPWRAQGGRNFRPSSQSQSSEEDDRSQLAEDDNDGDNDDWSSSSEMSDRRDENDDDDDDDDNDDDDNDNMEVGHRRSHHHRRRMPSRHHRKWPSHHHHRKWPSHHHHRKWPAHHRHPPPSWWSWHRRHHHRPCMHHKWSSHHHGGSGWGPHQHHRGGGGGHHRGGHHQSEGGAGDWQQNDYQEQQQHRPKSMTPDQMMQKKGDHHMGRGGGGGGKKPWPKHMRQAVMLMNMLHGTSCVRSDNQCLCCCGHFIPNAKNNTCDDVRHVLPGIDNAIQQLLAVDGDKSGRQRAGGFPKLPQEYAGLEHDEDDDEQPFDSMSVPPWNNHQY